jgi:hypothetical protein
MNAEEKPDLSKLTPLGRIRIRLMEDLPELRRKYPNMWIAYGADGMLLPPEADGRELFRKCQEMGLSMMEYVIEGTAPPLPTIPVEATL